MPIFKFIYHGEDGYDEEEIRVQGKWEICPECRGNGKYVNRAIDGNGITPEEFEEDPQFKEDYFNGVYDVVCEECGGSGKIVVPDRHVIHGDTLRKLEEWEQGEREWRQEMAFEDRCRRRGMQW